MRTKTYLMTSREASHVLGTLYVVLHNVLTRLRQPWVVPAINNHGWVLDTMWKRKKCRTRAECRYRYAKLQNIPPLICISLNKNSIFVVYLVLQSTPTHVMAGPGYSAIAICSYWRKYQSLLLDRALNSARTVQTALNIGNPGSLCVPHVGVIGKYREHMRRSLGLENLLENENKNR